jgi:hypothetical protein
MLNIETITIPFEYGIGRVSIYKTQTQSRRESKTQTRDTNGRPENETQIETAFMSPLCATFHAHEVIARGAA